MFLLFISSMEEKKNIGQARFLNHLFCIGCSLSICNIWFGNPELSKISGLKQAIGSRGKLSVFHDPLLAEPYQNSRVSLLLVKVSGLSWVAETADISGRVNRNIACDGGKDLSP